ncbi:MAG: hypothetical protein V1706_16780 [Pseudomonadota bacterium]
MNRAVPSSITIEEAVAEMVNMDYIPAGFTLLEMIAAFQEEAEANYENAQIDRLPEDQITPLKIRMESCRARHTLAHLLMESLQYEVDNPKDSMIVLSNDSSSKQRLTLTSVSDWAADRYGIGVSRWTNDVKKVGDNLKNVPWEDVTVKIWKDNKIGYSCKKGEFKRSHFQKIGLMGKVKNEPNQRGGILIGLSLEKKFPRGNYAEASEKTAISKLRRVLCKWVGLSTDPFKPCNESEGWKPRFTLLNDIHNADERAKKKATHLRYDESRSYDTDDIND